MTIKGDWSIILHCCIGLAWCDRTRFVQYRKGNADVMKQHAEPSMPSVGQFFPPSLCSPDVPLLSLAVQQDVFLLQKSMSELSMEPAMIPQHRPFGMPHGSLSCSPLWEMQTTPQRRAGFAFPSACPSDLAVCSTEAKTRRPHRRQQQGWGCPSLCLWMSTPWTRTVIAHSSGTELPSLSGQEVCTGE